MPLDALRPVLYKIVRLVRGLRRTQASVGRSSCETLTPGIRILSGFKSLPRTRSGGKPPYRREELKALAREVRGIMR